MSSDKVLFLGDSIMEEFLIGLGRGVWEEEILPMGAVNYGLGGACTEHIVELLHCSETVINGTMRRLPIDKAHPTVVVLMIGTNHSGHKESIVSGVERILSTLKEKWPVVKILLLGILPVAWPDRRHGNEAANVLLAGLGAMDIGPMFLKNGELIPELFWDGLHLTEAGYHVFAAAIKPTILEMLA